MTEGLSEQEVERLISKTKKVRKEEKEPIPYDFRLPNRISKNQLKILHSIHDSVGDSFGSYLVSKLQTMLTVKVTTVDQIYYSEYVLAVRLAKLRTPRRLLSSSRIGYATDDSAPKFFRRCRYFLLDGSSVTSEMNSGSLFSAV